MQNELQRRELAAAELAAHNPTSPPAEVIESLLSGLAQLRDLLTWRLHDDVQLQFGIDSMVAPASLSQEVKQIQQASVEIDAFTSVVVDAAVTDGRYVASPGEWFLDWIFQLRFGDGYELVRQEHADPYRGLTDKGRRLRFASVLHQAVPESMRTPPVLFVLYPLSVRIIAAMAFGDSQRAQKLRAEQVGLLPAIGDCDECRGRVLDNGQSCRNCGNPVWTFTWLRAV
jgi:hypothetical protein